MLTNRPEFHIADTAAMSLGATPFSLYQTLTPDQIAYQLNDSGAEIVVTEPAFLEQRAGGARAGARRARIVIVVDAPAGDGRDPVRRPARRPRATRAEIDRERAAVEPDDLLTLIYTSGTTGPPKGVQLTHHNMMFAVQAFDDVIDFPEGARVVSYLPMAHIAERATGHYMPIVLGHTVTCCPNPREVIAYLPEVRPSWFFAVPRIWEKLKAGLEAMIESEQDEQRKTRAEVGARRRPPEGAGRAGRRAGARRSWPRSTRRRTRWCCRSCASSSASTSSRRSTSARRPTPLAGAGVLPRDRRAGGGAVGPVGEHRQRRGEPARTRSSSAPSARCTPGMEMKLAEDGEVLIRGPQIMKGYRNMPDKTAEAIDADGWLHTGDIGELDDEGYLKIVDRKKELIITAGGKNISPANLEAKLKAHPLIGTACVIGDDRPFLTALIVLDADVAPAWAAQQGIEDTSLEALAERRARAGRGPARGGRRQRAGLERRGREEVHDPRHGLAARAATS